MPKPKGPPRQSRCGRCGAAWSALGACHCSSCHETFASLTAFEKHRKMVNQRQAVRECVAPADLGFVQHENGTWGLPVRAGHESWWKERGDGDDDE